MSCSGIYSTSGASSKTNRPSPSLHLLDAAPHVLPPASSLCGPFTRGLLSPLDNTRDKTTGQDPNTSGRSWGNVFMFFSVVNNYNGMVVSSLTSDTADPRFFVARGYVGPKGSRGEN